MIVPAAKLLKHSFDAETDSSGQASSDGSSVTPAVVVVLPEGFYHAFVEAWAEPRTFWLHDRCADAPSMLQQLIDVGISAHVETVERLCSYRKELERNYKAQGMYDEAKYVRPSPVFRCHIHCSLAELGYVPIRYVRHSYALCVKRGLPRFDERLM